MKVTDAMVSDVQTCRSQSSLEEVARLMWDNDIGSIPVVTEDNRPLGIVTDRDIAMSAMHNHKPLWEIQASQLIQDQRLCCCDQDESIESCLEKMEQNEIRRMLVTNEEGRLCGIISIGDIVAFTSASGRPARGRGDRISTENAMELLKNVSAHHDSSGRQAGASPAL